jgi:hypothetical protein
MFAATAAFAADPVASCQPKKLKAWAKLRSCEHKEAAKAVLGKIPDLAQCQDKLPGCRYLSMETGTVTDLDTGLMR